MRVFIKLFAELNLGDDLFLKILLERYPDVDFVIFAKEDYKLIFKDYSNLTVINHKSLKHSKSFQFKLKMAILRKMFPKTYILKLQEYLRVQYESEFIKSDAFVSIGGSIFIQPRRLPTYEDVELYNLANELINNVYFIGCNFGPYNDPAYKLSYDEIFSRAKDVCFREDFSYQLFKELKNVRCNPDVVFGLNIKEISKEKKSVGFSIISPRNGIDKDKYLKKYAELIQFYQRKGYSIKLFSFCRKHGDEITIDSVLDRIEENRNIEKIYYRGDINEFLHKFSSVEMVFCGRFHAMILSMILNQRFLAIAYSKKMTNVLEDINFKGSSLLIEDFQNISPQELNEMILNNTYDIGNQINESKAQFAKLDLLLQ